MTVFHVIIIITLFIGDSLVSQTFRRSHAILIHAVNITTSTVHTQREDHMG